MLTSSCVVGCTNSHCKGVPDHFYQFLEDSSQMQRWIAVIQRINVDGSAWQPSTGDRVCSVHCVSGEKNNNLTRPGYDPTLNETLHPPLMDAPVPTTNFTLGHRPILCWGGRSGHWQDQIQLQLQPSGPSTLHCAKKCPSLMPALLHLYNTCWSTHAAPQAWKVGAIHLLGKSKAASCCGHLQHCDEHPGGNHHQELPRPGILPCLSWKD